MLNNTQIKQFHDQGFLVLEKAIAQGHIASIMQAAQDIVADFDIDRHQTVFSTTDRDADRDDYFFDSAEAVHCFLEEGALDANGQLTCPKHLAINKIGHAMHDLVPEFTAFCRLAVIGQVLREIGYLDPQLWQSMYIFKQPGIGGEVRWHQDASYLITKPACVTGIWVALEDAHQGNGCLWVQPGHHRSPLREIYQVDWQQRSGVLTRVDDTPWSDNNDAIPLEVPAGSMVLFNDHLPHYSSQNYSAESRQAFTMHVAESSSSWLPENWLQRNKLGEFCL